ncbi:Uncharacterised protein [Bacillus freudenreichii]|nr:Uncharacterised protein [Bacillus freudenreichii]
MCSFLMLVSGMQKTNHNKAFSKAFTSLKGEWTISEIEEWVNNHYGRQWKDTKTTLANTVSESDGETLFPPNWSIIGF